MREDIRVGVRSLLLFLTHRIWSSSVGVGGREKLSRGEWGEKELTGVEKCYINLGTWVGGKAKNCQRGGGISNKSQSCVTAAAKFVRDLDKIKQKEKSSPWQNSCF